LHTDASSIAIAAILLQQQSNGSFAPIAYYSRATNFAESRYHSFELEMLAIIKAIERFHVYLYGINFTVVTDCNAINKANLNPRIARWVLHLQNYSFNMIHRKGNKMIHVDALSRMVALVNPIPLEQELQYRQLADSQIQEIANQLENADHDKFELIEGLVYRKFEDKPRFYVPESMVHNVICIYHDQCAHCGIEKTVQGICENYWFPSARKRVQNYINDCLTCLIANTSVNTKEGKFQFQNTPLTPLHTVHVDHFGSLIE